MNREREHLLAQENSKIPNGTTHLSPVITSSIRLNVGGRQVTFKQDTLEIRCPNSRLAKFTAKSHGDRLLDCDSYMATTKEYYFERPSNLFEHIIDFYFTGDLHRPQDVCVIRYCNELEFWQIPLHLLSPCCRFDGYEAEIIKNTLPDLTTVDNKFEWCEKCPPTLFEKIPYGKRRMLLWNFFDMPNSSRPARAFASLSALFVIISVTVLILGSMPELQHEGTQEPHRYLNAAEVICMLWFTSEYLIRLLVYPNKCEFIKAPLNGIDLMTVLPFYIEECMRMLSFNTSQLRNIRGPMMVIRLVRLARVARIFKLARYSSALQQFGATMRNSLGELSMLGMFLLTGVMLFSTAIYAFERDELNSKFFSIPAASWWCVITMTTVGYGDIVPVTAGGKIIASAASVCGIIVLAFPISMIIDKFNNAGAASFPSGNFDRGSIIGTSSSSSAICGPFVRVHNSGGERLNTQCLGVPHAHRARRTSHFL